MYLAADSLDDLLRLVIKNLFEFGEITEPTKGKNYEISGVLLELRNPRSRLSRTESKGKIYSCLGEFLWYMSRKNDALFIDYYIPGYAKRYSDDGGKTIHGGYGPRLFSMYGHNQVRNVISLLKRKSSSRRAVIQLFNAGDLSRDYRDIPCTCTLQFMVRGAELNLITHMRSNDAFIGLPHDIFSFTMLQEVIARSLNVELGTYKHLVGSMHLYDSDLNKARSFIGEGLHENISMESMPIGDPWIELNTFQKYANEIRQGKLIYSDFGTLDKYWQTLLRLLQIYHFTKPEFKNVDLAKEVFESTDWGDLKLLAAKRLSILETKNSK